jgi:hypothetical protein
MKKRKIPPEQWAALQAQWAEGRRKLAERIAYHEAKLAEERRAAGR